MDKYRLLEEHTGGDSNLFETGTHQHAAPSEIRITQQGKPRNYITYAMNLFSDGSTEIAIRAMGRAINKAVTIAEILKRKLPLHQITSLTSIQMIDVFEPLEEGLDVVTSKRFVSCIKIALSLTGEDMNVNDKGYQPPLHLQQQQQQQVAATTTAAWDERGYHALP